ncbi:unnamed protein product [Prorocentrum cordatum]|uniref:EF-hand domain-containing protein n=1 Tax=Prorocentrum cordatum TaxID=2364126 RepID=A0ABN9UF24_9DINO|nr:unnamed protein product [Polarella glacialis]
MPSSRRTPRSRSAASAPRAPISRRATACSSRTHPPAPAAGGRARTAPAAGTLGRTQHCREFSHPGDLHYCLGTVAFSPYQAPEFETLWQLFSYFDPEGAGYLDQARFSEALRACLKAPDGGLIEGAWCDTGGEAQGVANFCRFAAWAESYPLALPLGLSAGGGALPIRCHGQVRTTAGELLPCGCECYSPSWPSAPSVYAHPPACHCGHRRGRHWCDADARLLGKAMRPASWTEDTGGLVPVHDVGLLRQLQELLTRSHKDRPTIGRGIAGVPSPLRPRRGRLQPRVRQPEPAARTVRLQPEAGLAQPAARCLAAVLRREVRRIRVVQRVAARP